MIDARDYETTEDLAAAMENEANLETLKLLKGDLEVSKFRIRQWEYEKQKITEKIANVEHKIGEYYKQLANKGKKQNGHVDSS